MKHSQLVKDLLKAVRYKEYNLRRRLKRIEKRGINIPFSYTPYVYDKNKDDAQLIYELEEQLDELEYGDTRLTYLKNAENYQKEVERLAEERKIKENTINNIFRKIVEINDSYISKLINNRILNYDSVKGAIEEMLESGMSEQDILNNTDKIIDRSKDIYKEFRNKHYSSRKTHSNRASRRNHDSNYYPPAYK